MKAKYFILLSAALAVIFSSCTAEPNSTGDLSIEVRKEITRGTFYPENGSQEIAITQYRVSGSGPDDASISPRKYATNEEIFIQGLVKGVWTITVEALDSSDTAIMSGSKTVYISASNNSCTISISECGNGTLAPFDVTINGAVSGGVLRVTSKQYGSNDSETELKVVNDITGNQKITIDGKTEMPSGKYLIRGILKNSDTEMLGGFTHLVQISNSKTTTISETAINISPATEDQETSGGITIDDKHSKTLVGEIQFYPTPEADADGAYGIGQRITAVYKEGTVAKESNESLIAEWYIDEIPIDDKSSSIQTDEFLDESGNPRPAVVFAMDRTGTFNLKVVVYSSLYGSMGISEASFKVADLAPTGSVTKTFSRNLVLKDFAFLSDGSVVAVTSDGKLARYSVSSANITELGTPIENKGYDFVEADTDLGIIFAASEDLGTVDTYYLNGSGFTQSATLDPDDQSTLKRMYGTYDKIFDMKLNPVSKVLYLTMEDIVSETPKFKYATIEMFYICTNNVPSVSK